MNKKQYIAPSVGVFRVDITNMCATSTVTVGIFDTTTNADASMSREFSDNWNELWGLK